MNNKQFALRWMALMSVPLWLAGCAGGMGGAALQLADEGSFFVNGQSYRSEHPGASLNTGPAPAGNITINQMYVQYRIPASRTAVPIVMVHGSQHTGKTYETTPDGREGWATWFVRHGHPVYVVDQVGRGRSGFNPTPVNAVRAGAGDPGKLPIFFLGPIERAWANFRFGPEYPKPFPNMQFPLDALDQYLAQLVPNAETTLPGGGRNTVNALAALLDKIGPAVVFVHSQSGVYGLDVVRKRPALVRALVSVEGGCETMTAHDAATSFASVPFISVWGDNSVGAWGVNGDKRRNGCLQAVKHVQAAKGKARLLLLPEAGVMGNSHMMMMDRNNLQVAGLIREWLSENVR
jgi:pimeloyl-ACP methyl ester carboxylesterase